MSNLFDNVNCQNLHDETNLTIKEFQLLVFFYPDGSFFKGGKTVGGTWL